MSAGSVKQLVHDSLVHSRRVRVLQSHLSTLLPDEGLVLDVGCGDGLLAQQLLRGKPGLEIEGIDVLSRPNQHIRVTSFDGTHIPYPDQSIDVVMFVDVLHHTADPLVLLKEAKRVSRRSILIKDHLLQGILCRPTLRFMDWVGNAHHGVALPYNYWSEDRWRRSFQELGLDIERWMATLRLYPAVADWIFGRSLHFIARLKHAST